MIVYLLYIFYLLFILLFYYFGFACAHYGCTVDISCEILFQSLFIIVVTMLVMFLN